MYVIAVSGGPDSMWLLNKNKNKKIVVAHINYNIRNDSNVDQKIVQDFCDNNNIQLEILELNKNSVQGNFQDWARIERYNFFKKVYKKYNANKLLVGHHKDDFLETAMMQQNANKTPEEFGIKRKSNFMDLNIERPFIHKYWKKDIMNKLHNKNIDYAIDSSNSQSVYTRNKIRLDLMDFPQKKIDIYKWFILSNKILRKKNAKIIFLYNQWSKSEFEINFLKHSKFKNELVFKFVHSYNLDIKITTNKINSIISFIFSNKEAKKYKLKDDIYIFKKNKQLFIKHIKNN